MADKLDKDDWAGFVKKHKLELDDKALVKALAALDKAGEDKPDERAKALSEVVDEIREQVKALTKRKKELGDKPFGLAKDKLYALLELAESGHRAAQDAAAEARQKAGKAGKDDDEDDDSPAVLTTKMVPLIRQLKKGKGEVRYPALIGSISKSAAVLISKRTISSAKRKLLNEALDAKGGVKFAKGECYYDTGALHFVMEGKIGGLAKRVRAALLDQTGLRLKVKLRGEDGEELDGEEEAEDAAAAGGAPGAGPAEAKGGSPLAPPGGPAGAEELAYVQRLRKVHEGYDAALKAQHPESTKLRALMGFASEKAAAKDFVGAGKALDMLASTLRSAGEAGGIAAGGDTAREFNARLAALLPDAKALIGAGSEAGQRVKLMISEAGALARQERFAQGMALLDQLDEVLRAGPGGQGAPGAATKVVDVGAYQDAAKACLKLWLDAKESADSGLAKLQSALTATGEPALQHIADKGLNGVSQGVQVGIRVALQEFATTGDPTKVDLAARRLRDSVSKFRRFLDDEPAVRLCDDNPFNVRVDLRPTLSGALDAIERRLDALS